MYVHNARECAARTTTCHAAVILRAAGRALLLTGCDSCASVNVISWLSHEGDLSAC